MSDAWERDAAAGFVEELFAAHHGEIYAYLIRMLRDPELAADLTQDAFVKAYRNYDTSSRRRRTPGPGCTRSPTASRSTTSAARRSSASCRGPARATARRRRPSGS